MSSPAHRQARVAERAKNAGQERIGIWIPGEVHAKVKHEAAARGITMRQRIIEKLSV
jgi:LDH2 family malate/lactate/ureidoglycolate dehydrogenase